MNLIYKTIVFRVDDCAAIEKLVQESRSARSINSAEPCNDPTSRENHILRLAQNLSGLTLRLGCVLLRNPLAVFLCVNTRTAGEQDARIHEAFGQIAGTVQVNAPIRIGIAAARTRAMNHRVEI